MGLSDDIDDDPRSEKQAAAEASVTTVQERVHESDVEGALAAVGDLLDDLWELDEDAFSEVGDEPTGMPTAYIPTEYGMISVGTTQDEEPGRMNLSTVAGSVSMWVTIPEASGGSTGFSLDPETALWLADVLPEFAARAKAGEYWEYSSGEYSGGEYNSES